ncbi:hypothetical protein Cgig2_028430 [Carnegiea gigantea]|uniref:Signal peptidase complex subunit 2 n=1 Tax=Carnegiea gigantea TaxID=171969 RepID=A0A9Q1KPD2_9CARY|nr:hypothetical protein Cgig2_028430 [Carnegiea gigantea]
MATDSTTKPKQNPKKANLLDHHSLKHILDESAIEVVKARGYVEDVRLSNVRLLMGTIIIIIALVAQFYPKKFPENRNFLIGCIILYPFLYICSVVFIFLWLRVINLIIYTKEKNAIMFTYPPPGSFNMTGLVLSSKLPRFSDMFTKDGVLVEGLFWKDVEGLIDEYNKEPKKSK